MSARTDLSMKDRMLCDLAWWLPARLVYWCAMRLIAHASTGRYSATEMTSLTCVEAVNRFHHDHFTGASDD